MFTFYPILGKLVITLFYFSDTSDTKIGIIHSSRKVLPAMSSPSIFGHRQFTVSFVLFYLFSGRSELTGDEGQEVTRGGTGDVAERLSGIRGVGVIEGEKGRKGELLYRVEELEGVGKGSHIQSPGWLGGQFKCVSSLVDSKGFWRRVRKNRFTMLKSVLNTKNGVVGEMVEVRIYCINRPRKRSRCYGDPFP